MVAVRRETKEGWGGRAREDEVDEEVEQKGVDGGWVGWGEWVVVLSLITSQDGQERETPERMPLRRARRRPVCWIEANISAMSYHQPYTRLPIFVLSYFPSLSIPYLSLLLYSYLRLSTCSLSVSPFSHAIQLSLSHLCLSLSVTVISLSLQCQQPPGWQGPKLN